MKKYIIFVLSTILCLSMNVVHAQDEVTTRMNQMTLKEKIEQMLMVDFRNWDMDTTDNIPAKPFTEMNEQVKSVIESHQFGSIILFAENIQETKQSYYLTDAMQRAAIKNNGIPLLISSDQEGGIVYRLGSGTALPGNMALGAAKDPKYARMAGEIIGRELSVLGINTDLAPVVDVNNNANNPVIGLRSFSDDPNIVGQLAVEVINGLKKYNIVSAAKHFPGHGDVATDSHYGLPIVNKTKQELLQNELLPYKQAINNNIDMIMSAHILYPTLEKDTLLSEKTGKQEALPATMSDDILTKLLKEEMQFKGIIVTDAMNMQAISNTWGESQAVIESIKAGADLICMPTNLQSLSDINKLDSIIQNVIDKVNEGYIPETRINDAVKRILTVKQNRGILNYTNPYTLEEALNTVGSTQNRLLEREIAAASVTVVKNKDQLLPLKLKENQKVLMLAPYDNEKAQLLMGINRAKELGIVPSNIEVKVQRFNASSTIDSMKDELDWADVVFINSEISRASRMGYKHWLSKTPNDIVNYLHDNQKKSIIMSVDKPYDVQLYPNADAILAVYGAKGSSVDVTEALLNGTTTSKEAYGPNIIAGVEVALGTFAARGVLPVNIPTYNSESDNYDESIVYPRGYGLTYNSVLDKSKLIQIFRTIESLNKNQYTNESYQNLNNKYQELKPLETKLVSQKTIDESVNQLLNLYNKLEKKVKTPIQTQTQTPSIKTESQTSSIKDKSSKPTKQLSPKKQPIKQVSQVKKVDTNDKSNTSYYMILALLSVLLFIIFRNKLNKQV